MRRLRAIAVAAIAVLTVPTVSVADPGVPDPAAAGHPAPAATGPVGWDTYRQLDGLARLRAGEQTRQFSSFDRAGGNNDGFEGTYSCLRVTGDECVIAEQTGAGEISSIWFTRDYGSMAKNGRIVVTLDGSVVLDAPVQDVVDGTLGAPFVWPLVGNGEDAAGGAVIKVPMPYRESMTVAITGAEGNNPYFHHVAYRVFADASGVTTFDPADQAQDVVDRLRAFGVADPKPAPADPQLVTSTSDIAAGAAETLGSVSGSGQITALSLQLPQVVASPRVVDDGRAYGAGGGSSFTVAVSPANDGVRLTRRYDPLIADQRATVTVDGQPVGEWSSDASAEGQWADQTIEIPAALTTGKSTLDIANAFVSSGLDVNEFRYDVHSLVDGVWVRTDVLDLGASHPGEEQAHGYAVTNQTWAGSHTNRYPVDPAELAESDDVLSGARLRISFDGKTTVDAPIGEFFGSGIGEYDTRTLMSSIDATPEGWYTSWWPMPFGQRATVELVNDSGVAITGASVRLTWAPDGSVKKRLKKDGGLGYFSATHHSGPTTNTDDWTFLDTSGQGIFYGVTHSMRGDIPSGNRRAYLEGDERVYVDGSATPAIHGTGTEDFYESGWYFRDGTTFSMPLAGNPAYELDGDGCEYDCTGAYRLMLPDAIGFSSGLRFVIEHGPGSDAPADYSSTAYWYGQPAATLARTDVVDVTDPASRAAHSYQAAGETTATVESTYETGPFAAPVSRPVAAATGSISFTAKVDSKNAGVSLVRLGDQAAAYQQAAVFVDDQPAGTWTQPLGNTTARWLEDRFDVPSSLTAGKRSVTVRLEPAGGSPAWSAARYRVLSVVAAYVDTSAPGIVSGLRATGGPDNALSLQWSEADDNVATTAYEVYGSTDPQVPVSANTLLATVPTPGFRHAGLGLEETWYYRVRAVDAAGNAGKRSGVASAITGTELDVEAELLLPAIGADAPVEAQGNCCGVVWSNNAQLWFRADSAGDAVTVGVDIPAAGSYALSGVWTQAVDYGVVTLALDGQPLGSAFDGFHSPNVVVAPAVDYGTVELSEGTHELTITVTGKNPSSTGFLAGLDRLHLSKI